MAVLNGAWEAVRLFPGADRVLAAHGPALPQPDQLCGPFSMALALHAVSDEVPTVVELALTSGTSIWPHDVSEWRPAGAPLDRTGWEVLPRAASQDTSGTNALWLAPAVHAATLGEVATVPVFSPDASGLGRLLEALTGAAYDVGVVANLRTGALGEQWDVGHFVVLLGSTDDGQVAVADTYPELGAEGAPPGCRLVAVDALARALCADPGRGLLLVVRTHDSPAASDLVRASGLSVQLWSA